MQRNKTITTKVLTRAAILTALSIILTRFLSIMLTENLRIGFGSLPIMISGMMFGPLVGGLTGLVADIIGVLINPQGAFHLGFTLSSVLTGALPGLVVLLTRKDKGSWLNIVLSIVVVYGLVHLCLNSFWLTQLYGQGFMIVMPGRVVKVLAEGVVMGVILGVFFKTIAPKLD
ncbi:folate family ECF transporter S component [Peptoniphilus equinus]|uniref:Folate family ECF transporter S component n=1 Tax=Peptoniphilus equinus TaxID=3016343 RepID=A0ABY7QU41_9FIRM|nr:folate family ECF transporter S component [Peptoniphilus equinus]WBW50298.1 folate family ECF transporter S component [Peptoniphilus equinus]